MKKWVGLITYASKYFLPPGATSEQTNMTCLLPGQLSVRGGMKDASKGSVTGGRPALEMYGYSVSSGSVDKVFVFTQTANGSAGQITIVESPDV